MSKLDFDFSDVTGQQHTVDKTKSEHSFSRFQPKTIQKKKSTDTGTILAIPTDKGFISKDLGECTGEEFLAWVQAVYPFIQDENPQYFDNLAARKRAFHDIVQYHQGQMFATKDSDPNTRH